MSELDITKFEGHTPGPWWMNEQGTYVLEEEGCDGGALVICSLAAVGEPSERFTNGRLIAAAPDLLAEVKRLREERDNLNFAIKINHDENTQYVKHLEAEHDKLRQAATALANELRIEMRMAILSIDDYRDQVLASPHSEEHATAYKWAVYMFETFNYMAKLEALEAALKPEEAKP